ncbi:hypothetical protein Bpfe_008812, partial [Biomphalaria pfeifferi]
MQSTLMIFTNNQADEMMDDQEPTKSIEYALRQSEAGIGINPNKRFNFIRHKSLG